MQLYKDPAAVLDYGFTWAAWLVAGDTITASTWAVPAGLTAGATSIVGAVTTVWLSGGTLGVTYEVVNHITTAAGRQEDQTHHITMVSK